MPALPKLLYLGFAFPPGVAGRFPEAQPAGHLIETNLVSSILPWFEIRSVGISWIDVAAVPPGDNSPGLPHALNLLEKRPELPHRWRAVTRLKREYRSWCESGWKPEVILVCNFSPVYNAFIRWLARQPGSPCVVLYLADSLTLQRTLGWMKRLRYFLKPLKWPDAEMVAYVAGCVAVSRSTEQFFAARGRPWLWLPNGCDSRRALRPDASRREGPIQFGYFGTLARHGGAPDLIRIFTARERRGLLHLCGFGKTKEEIAAQCRAHPQLRFHEPRTSDECVRLAANWDVLVNPRPIVPGNENNFSSKVFEYVLSARPILTSCLSGTELVLGPEAFYFDATDYDATLDAMLLKLADTPRAELNRHGEAIQARVLANWAWPAQGERLAGFLKDLLAARDARPRQRSATSGTLESVRRV